MGRRSVASDYCGHVLSPFGTTITIFGRLCGQLPGTAKWLLFTQENTLRIQLVSSYGNGAGLVRVHHMSPYNTCELGAPSPRFVGLMHSWYHTTSKNSTPKITVQPSRIAIVQILSTVAVNKILHFIFIQQSLHSTNVLGKMAFQQSFQ